METGYLAFGLIVALAVGLALSRAIQWKDSAFKEAASIFQAVLTAGAILLTGYWYFVDRKGQPHADLSQIISVEPLKPGYVAVETQISIKNLGEKLLTIKQAQFVLQRVSPPLDAPAETSPEELSKLPPKSWPAHGVIGKDGYATPIFNDSELVWPPIRMYDSKETNDIEPGETDTMIATFIVNCDMKVVRVEAYVLKGGTGNSERWWHSAGFADVRKECERKIDGKDQSTH
jgi:hypothetical protein